MSDKRRAQTARDAEPRDDSCSIIALDKFIQATRDSGYKGTSSAISEIVDNSIQASANHIEINVTASVGGDDEDAKVIDISVIDDGCGMDPFTLRQALRFGGSSRFGDRRGLGRYGMGLPNASLSQSKRVIVWTWQSPGAEGAKSTSRARRVYTSYLDVDEIARGELKDVPVPSEVEAPPVRHAWPSGTVVLWAQCDRLDNRRVSTITRKLEAELGRRFRHFLWRGLKLTINGKPVTPFDPLYLNERSSFSGATLFSEEKYEVCADPTKPEETGWVTVRFSELPVHEWHTLSNEEKRRHGISKGAGVSIVRAGREVDYGWFFLGGKHRENYDDWWRCEILFDPVLDEAFGITHTKQQVRPQAHILEALTADIEATARVLNARARKGHLEVKAGERFSETEQRATDREHLLEPLPTKPRPEAKARMAELEQRHPALRRRDEEAAEPSRYRVLEDSPRDTCFFDYAFDGDKLVLALNPEHPFYREIYRPLNESDAPRDQQLRVKLELLLLAAARSEVSTKSADGVIAKHRRAWSNTLATFLNK